MNVRNIDLGAVAGLAIGVFVASCGNNNECNSSNCSTGCCDSNGACQTGSTAAACGSGGGTCSVCSAAQTCQAGACVAISPGGDAGQPDAGPDAGQPDAGGPDGGMPGADGGFPHPVGGSCDAGTDCTSMLCLDEASTGGFFPGGYCTANCTNTSCPAGSSCAPEFGGSMPRVDLCLANCNNAGAGQDICRPGYVCDKNFVTTAGQASCFPACNSAADCAADGGVPCESGYCCGIPLGKCCSGTRPCLDNSACGADGYCP